MKFQLNQVVQFEGKRSFADAAPGKYRVLVWDYSLRYNEYDIRLESGQLICGVQEEELSGFPEEEQEFQQIAQLYIEALTKMYAFIQRTGLDNDDIWNKANQLYSEAVFKEGESEC